MKKLKLILAMFIALAMFTGTAAQAGERMVGAVDGANIAAFSADTLGGDEAVTGAIFADNNLTLVTLWSAECSYASAQLANLQAMQAQYGTLGVGALSVLVAGDETEGAQLASESAPELQHIAVDHVLADALYDNLLCLPTTFAVDAQGEVRQAIGGLASQAYLERIARGWLYELGFDFNLPGASLNPEPITPEPNPDGVCGFAGTDIYYNEIDGSVFQAQHMSVVIRWADWCTYCKAQFASMNRLQEDFARYGIVPMGYVVEDTTELSAQSVVDQYGVHFLHIMQNDFLDGFMSSGLPSTYGIAQDGSVELWGRGQMNYASLRALAREFLITNGLPYQSSDAVNLITPEPPAELEPGDMNGDGIVNVGDCAAILRYVLGIYTPTPEQINCSDVNGDGLVNTGDAAFLLVMICELP